MCFRRRRFVLVKYVAAALFAIVFYSEWFIYVMQPLYWHRLECPSNDSTCTKILLIADPQIQGEEAAPFPFNYIFYWDSDRYLKSTFNVVLKYFKPEVIVYLGDLMDEGSISTDKQYKRYADRFADIFEMSYDVVEVWVPGDNDIGGENEPIFSNKIELFKETFGPRFVTTYKNITFISVNEVVYGLPTLANIENTFKIIVSHYPLMKSSMHTKKINKLYEPNLYFCAHEHRSKYEMRNQELLLKEKRNIVPGDQILNVVQQKDTLVEIYVPTCSYRMGTSSIGYGAAVIENNNTLLRYTVFWSSRRFPVLFLYLVIFVCSLIYFFVFGFSKLYYCCRRFKRSSSPLLQKI